MKKIILTENELEIKNYLKKVISKIKKKKINIGVSGGKTWIKIYNFFKKEKFFDKNKFALYLTDERCSDNSLHSNYYHCCNNLLHNKKNIYKMFINDSIRESISYYNRILPKKLDLVLVGLGEDGHVLSWFKNSNAWKINKKIAFVKKNKKNFYPRITLTKSYINKSTNIYLLVNSLYKKKILKVFLLKKKNIPAHHLKIKTIFINKKLLY